MTKQITWGRTCKNLANLVRSCTPPILQKAIGLAPRKTTNTDWLPHQIAEEPQPARFLIPRTEPNLVWPGFDQIEITMLPRQLRNHLWAMPENELMVLSSICQMLQPKNVFEFGTFTGASTLAIAANTPEQTQIHTLDIPPEDRRTHITGVGSDIPFDYVIGESFIGTRWESKIQMHHQDARQFDTRPLHKKMDMIFVDSDHTYDFVKNDTTKATEMLAPGGVILWHDYRWDDDAPECVGVTNLVDEFHQQHGRCLEIKGTRFAIYQSSSSEFKEVAA